MSIPDIVRDSKFDFNNELKTTNINTNMFEIIQTGIGDILYNALLVKHGIINKPLFININPYISNIYRLNNPQQNLSFLIKLISFLFEKEDIILYNDNNVKYTSWEHKMRLITESNLLTNNMRFDNLFNFDYIVFHTKCRFTSSFDYTLLKHNMQTFCKSFKTQYKIIIWGERTMPRNMETDVHKITTIYQELLQLTQNNDVLDLTEENIYDTMDFDHYLKLLNIVANSKLNIVFGFSGGGLATTLCFGTKTIGFIQPNIMPEICKNTCLHNTLHLYDNYNSFFQKLNDYK
jgi:hypothetical protein